MSIREEDVSMNNNSRRISPLNAWAFSFACAIGWAAFIMPATTFLPEGGVMGSIIAFIAGGASMCLIALNYHYLGNLYPDRGGIYKLVKASSDRGSAFVAAWGMGLAHMCCIPLNAKAMAMLVRVFLEEALNLDFEVYFFHTDTLAIEAILIIVGLILFGLINVRGIKVTALAQTIGAILLLGGIVIILIATALTVKNPPAAVTPLDPPNTSFIRSFMSIFLITPWAYVGFDSLSKISQELNFPVKKIGMIMIIAVICATFAYVGNILTTILSIPEGFASWTDYLESLKDLPGVEGFPVAIAAKNAMGHVGTAVFFISCISATLTGLVGFFASVSRLIRQMAEDSLLPPFLSKIDSKRGAPKNAIWTVVTFALLLSLARDSFDFIEEVASVGTSVGFGLCAFGTLAQARKRKDKLYIFSGAVGAFLSLFWLFFMFVHTNGIDMALSVKALFLLLIWIFLGIADYSFFTRDRSKSEIDIDLNDII